MTEIFFTTVNAVLPIVLLIALGYVLRRINFLSDGFLKTGNKLVFNVFLPCMLFVNVYDSMDSFADIRWDVVVYSLILILVIFALGFVSCLITTKERTRRGVILQCSFRSNFAIIGLTLVERLGGNGALAGVLSAFSIPLFNVLAVISLTIFVKDEGVPQDIGRGRRFWTEAKRILKGIVTNPLIIGVVTGLLFVGIRELERAVCGDVPFRFDTQLKFLYTCVCDLKLVASPFALIVLGGQFKFSAVRGMTKEIIVGTAARIIVAPLLGIGLALLLSAYTDIIDFGPEVYPSLIALFATPVAVSSAVMAGAMNCDEQLATQYVVWTSVFSVITIFALVFGLMSGGLLAV